MSHPPYMDHGHCHGPYHPNPPLPSKSGAFVRYTPRPLDLRDHRDDNGTDRDKRPLDSVDDDTPKAGFVKRPRCRDSPEHALRPVDSEEHRDDRPSSADEFYRNPQRSFDERRMTFSQSQSWTVGEMSWEVPPNLSGSFGLERGVEDDLEEEMRGRGFPLAPRPSVATLARRSRSPVWRRDYERHERDYNRYYSNRSPPRHGHGQGPRYEERRYYEDDWHRREERFVSLREPQPPMGYRDTRGRREMRYEEERRRRPSPPYFANEPPGRLLSGSRSFDSRSIGDLDEPGSALLYRPSFSWERGLDVPPPEETPRIMVSLQNQQKMMKALAMRNEIRTIGNPRSAIGLILLLSMPNDRHCLSETLCIIRNNVEVFTATASDISAPAPGRKKPVQIGQVGLRCVYCRMCHNDRVKRAICFPSSMKRIYRSVIDMKLDHFPSCPYVPPGLKARLEELSVGSARSTGMTVQYFVKSAKDMGMVDMEEGVHIDLKRVGTEHEPIAPYGQFPYRNDRALPPPPPDARKPIITQSAGPNKVQFKPYRPNSAFSPAPAGESRNPKVPPSPAANRVQFKSSNPSAMEPIDPNIRRYHGQVPLSLPDDSSFLSPLRCFLRHNVCAFTATEKDIAVRTPTTFSVRVGQVGVGCMHCVSVPPKQRSNRAVCFPFTVARIYQSVADIQRFHLGECRMMPPDVRAEFLRLQSESAKGSRGLATRTYWIDSARRIGLADGPNGMYFGRDPALSPPADADSLDLLAQVATIVKTGSKPLITPEDKPTIADFLYVVMEQLQPCRFTDADRNKRRSKNLGSIGVECKHCAGKIDGRKFFWSSVSAAESNFVSVHSHMMDCKYISPELKEELARLKALRREQTAKLKTGSQKAFFTRVWDRLHVIQDDNEESKPRSDANDELPQLTDRTEALPDIKSMEHDVTFDTMELPTGGSQDEIRALLESKSTLSSVPSAEEFIKPASHERSGTLDTIEIAEAVDTDLRMGEIGDSANQSADGASKSSLTSVAQDLSAVTVCSKPMEGGSEEAEV